MKDRTWRTILAIVGLCLAVTGLICVIVVNMDKLTARVQSLGKKHSACPEFDDYDDDLLQE